MSACPVECLPMKCKTYFIGAKHIPLVLKFSPSLALNLGKILNANLTGLAKLNIFQKVQYI
jgi:hypothetical protein